MYDSNGVPTDLSNNSFVYTPVDFDTAFSNEVLVYNDAAEVPADTAPGSTLHAVFKANALMYAEQSLQITGPGGVVNIARLATCIGSDVDSFCGQFNVPRLPAVGSSGQITASVNVALSAQAVLYAGQVVGSNLGDVEFIVIADPTNPAYSESEGGYVAPAGTESVTASVICMSTGYATNVEAGELTVFLSSPLGVANQFTKVTNAYGFQNGKNEETDTAYKSRFVVQVIGGGTGTALACAAQALLADTNLFYSIGDPWNPDTHAATPGYLTIYLGTNGSGIGVTSTVIGTAQALVNVVRAGGIIAQVRAVSLVPISMGMTVKVGPGFDPPTVGLNVQTALATYLNTIKMDPVNQQPTTMPAYFPFVVAFGVPGVIDVVPGSMTINGTTPADVSAPFGSQIVAGTITVVATT